LDTNFGIKCDKFPICKLKYRGNGLNGSGGPSGPCARDGKYCEAAFDKAQSWALLIAFLGVLPPYSYVMRQRTKLIVPPCRESNSGVAGANKEGQIPSVAKQVVEFHVSRQFHTIQMLQAQSTSHLLAENQIEKSLINIWTNPKPLKLESFSSLLSEFVAIEDECILSGSKIIRLYANTTIISLLEYLIWEVAPVLKSKIELDSAGCAQRRGTVASVFGPIGAGLGSVITTASAIGESFVKPAHVKDVNFKYINKPVQDAIKQFEPQIKEYYKNKTDDLGKQMDILQNLTKEFPEQFKDGERSLEQNRKELDRLGKSDKVDSGNFSITFST